MPQLRSYSPYTGRVLETATIRDILLLDKMVPDVWVIRVDQLPWTVNEQRRWHHMTRAKKVKEWRELACWLSREAKIPKMKAAHVHSVSLLKRMTRDCGAEPIFEEPNGDASGEMRIVVGAPVRRREWLAEQYVDHIAWATVEAGISDADLTLMFVSHKDDPTNIALEKAAAVYGFETIFIPDDEPPTVLERSW
jgi:hypothetical protein